MEIWRTVANMRVALSASPFVVLVTAQKNAFAAAPDADPGRAAREVFQTSSFWWKRIETRTVPMSWLESIVAAVADFFFQRLRDFGEYIVRFLRWLFRMFSGSSSDGSIVVWLIVIAAAGWSIWKLTPVIMGWLTVDRPAATTPKGETWEPLAEAADLYDQAGQAMRDGLYAETIRLTLLAVIARLEKQGLLRYDTTRTNREYQRELRRKADLAARFGLLAKIYERVWYGRLPAIRAEAEEAISLCGSMINREEPAPE